MEVEDTSPEFEEKMYNVLVVYKQLSFWFEKYKSGLAI